MEEGRYEAWTSRLKIKRFWMSYKAPGRKAFHSLYIGYYSFS